MVEQNRVPLDGGWRGSVPPPPEPEPKRKRVYGAGLVVTVQSAACVVVLLLALLLRTAGGEPYAQLCHSFQESLMRNDLLATLAALWDGDSLEDVSSELEETNKTAPAADDSTTTTTPATTTTTTATAPTVTGTAGDALPTGVLAVPLRVNHIPLPPVPVGTLTSGYGYREDSTGDGEQFHRGVDIAAPAGTPIAAMFYGKVIAVGENDSFGKYIRLCHGEDVEVLYAHCSAILAQEGTVVRGGDRVALVGATGDATGDHVHIEISDDGLIYDPTRVVPIMRYA